MNEKEVRLSPPMALPLLVDIIDQSIEVFASLFPLQSANQQELCVDRMLTMCRNVTSGLKSPVDRKELKHLMYDNVMCAVVGILKYCLSKKEVNGSLKTSKVYLSMKIIAEVPFMISAELS